MDTGGDDQVDRAPADATETHTPRRLWVTPDRNEDPASQERDEVVEELLAAPVAHLLDGTRESPDHSSACVQALALNVGTFRHLYRMCRFVSAPEAAAVAGPGALQESFEPLLRELTRQMTLEFSSSLVFEAARDASDDTLDAFHAERRGLTAGELDFQSTRGAQGALVLLQAGPEGHLLDDRMSRSWLDAYSSLGSPRRAWMLVATSAGLTEPEKNAEVLLSHATVADLYGTDRESVTKRLHHARTKLKERLAPLKPR